MGEGIKKINKNEDGRKGGIIIMKENGRYQVVYETDCVVDGFYCDDFETAKVCALDVLSGWIEEVIVEEGCTENIKDWTEKQKENWDYMIYNCSVSVRDKKLYNEEDFGEIWSPSYSDEEEIGWVTYEELLKKYNKN